MYELGAKDKPQWEKKQFLELDLGHCNLMKSTGSSIVARTSVCACSCHPRSFILTKLSNPDFEKGCIGVGYLTLSGSNEACLIYLHLLLRCRKVSGGVLPVVSQCTYRKCTAWHCPVVFLFFFTAVGGAGKLNGPMLEAPCTNILWFSIGPSLPSSFFFYVELHSYGR